MDEIEPPVPLPTYKLHSAFEIATTPQPYPAATPYGFTLIGTEGIVHVQDIQVLSRFEAGGKVRRYGVYYNTSLNDTYRNGFTMMEVWLSLLTPMKDRMAIVEDLIHLAALRCQISVVVIKWRETP